MKTLITVLFLFNFANNSKKINICCSQNKYSDRFLMSFLWFIFSQLDFFRSPLYLFINNQSKRSTATGICFSLTLIIVLVINFCQSNMVQKTSPNVVAQTKKNAHSAPINFDNKTLLAFSVADPNGVRYVDPTYFQVKFFTFHLKTNELGMFDLIEAKNYPLKLCSLDDVTFDPSLYQKLALKNAYCLNKKKFTFEGYWDENEVTYGFASLSGCNNQTSNNTCKPQEKIDEYFSSANPKFFGTMFQGVSLIKDDFEDPIKPLYEKLFQLVDVNIMKRFNVLFKKVNVITDDGWFFSSKSTITDFYKDVSTRDFITRSQNDSLSQILFYASHNSDEVLRRYQSFPEVLASLSGIGNFFIVVLCVLTNLKNHLETMQIILNSLYNFQNIEKKKKEKKHKKLETEEMQKCSTNDEKPKKIIEISNKDCEKKSEVNQSAREKQKENVMLPNKIHDDSFVLEHYSVNTVEHPKIAQISESPAAQFEFPKLPTERFKSPKLQHEKTTDLNEDIKFQKKENSIISISQKNKASEPSKKFRLSIKIKQAFHSLSTTFAKKKKDSRYKLSLTFIGYISELLLNLFRRKKSKKQRLLEKAESVFQKEMDIVYILSKIHEIEKLKLVIFNEDQLVLFNHLPNPMIFFEKDDEKKDYLGKKNSIIMSEIMSSTKDKNQKKYSDCLNKINQERNVTFNQRLLFFQECESSRVEF